MGPVEPAVDVVNGPDDERREEALDLARLTRQRSEGHAAFQNRDLPDRGFV